MALSSKTKLTGSYIFISGNSSFYKCQVPMENIKIGKNKRRDLFAEMANKVGEVLLRDGRLSILRIQRYLACGYAYASKIFDYLVNIDELYQSVRVNFSRSAFHRVEENKAYRYGINAPLYGYSKLQKAVMPNSVLQLAQVR
jgi:hypothetical protein